MNSLILCKEVKETSFWFIALTLASHSIIAVDILALSFFFQDDLIAIDHDMCIDFLCLMN